MGENARFEFIQNDHLHAHLCLRLVAKVPYKPDTGALQLQVLEHLVVGSALGEQAAEQEPQVAELADVAAPDGVGQKPMVVAHLELAQGQVQGRSDSRADESHGLERDLEHVAKYHYN